MDFVKRPVVIIIASICIAASFFVGGIFTGKLIEQTENGTDLNCTAVKGEYQKCIDDLEEELSRAKSMACIRDLAKENPDIQDAILTSVKPVKELMKNQINNSMMSGNL